MKSASKFQSKTINFFVAVLLAGGLDLINQFLENENVSWRSVALLAVALSGIALRLVTKDPAKL